MSSETPSCPECSNRDQVTSYVADERSRQKTQLDGVTVNTPEERVRNWSCKRCGGNFSTPA
jgi:transposase